MKPTIDNLLDRYWQGLTTPAEEEQLRQAFTQGQADPQHLATLFLAQQRLRQQHPADDFDQRVLRQLHTHRRHPLLLRAAPLLRAVAIVALAVALGHTLRHTLLRDNHTSNLLQANDTTTLQVTPGNAVTEAPADERQTNDTLLNPQPRDK